MIACQITATSAANIALAPDPSDARDVAIELDDLVRVDESGRYHPLFGTVDAFCGEQFQLRGEYGSLRWCWLREATVMCKAEALVSESDLLLLVKELLDDHAKLFNNQFPHGFRKPPLDEEYSLDLRQRMISALRDAEETALESEVK